MQHRRPRLSRKAKALLVGAERSHPAAAGVTVARAGEESKKRADFAALGKYYVTFSAVYS
ncbi:hypothetical protein StrepF001_29055 [Streptomyces sp. F001]|uniref:hypothetical protein n=1 Tax=Streptomyces sp. F001 TaxID=1510026 RepID=UPI00101E77DE|nr:hypothetical protein [Streptomyces sp. F001]RZB16210.1 hypothetical protein StrepF001_29055 [Streptomyces sp. F001]